MDVIRTAAAVVVVAAISVVVIAAVELLLTLANLRQISFRSKEKVVTKVKSFFYFKFLAFRSTL